MTDPRPPGPSSPPGPAGPPPGPGAGAGAPPEWFHRAQQERVAKEQAERERVAREHVARQQAQAIQAQRAQHEREQAQRAALARAQRTRHGPPGREVHGPVRQNETPWIGLPPGAMFPAAEDATMLIQRITDEAVPRDVREAATVMYQPGARPGAPVEQDGVTTRIPDQGAGDRSASAGMKTATTAGVVRAGALMAIATVVSRVTGLLSKIAILAILSVGVGSSAYTVANTLPNIVFELLIGGVLTSVAIPLLTRAQRTDSDGGLEYTQRLLTIAVVGLLVATVIAVFCAPLLARLYVPPGHTGGDELTQLTTSLSRFLLPQMFFYGIAALFGAILNTKERFAANAWAPVLNNIVVIGVAVVLWVAKFSPDGKMSTSEILILGIGTTLGIVLQAVVMIPSLLRSGFRFRWRWGWDKRLTEAGGLVGWAVVYVLISQVGVVVTTNVASRHSDGGFTTFSYASLLFQMPYGILGVAVLTAIMPRLSRHASAGEMEEVKDDVSLANRLSAVALFPVSAAFIVVGSGLAVALFNWKHVTIGEARQIGLTISGMAIGLVPLAMTLVQMRVFYAMKDGRTPTLINGIMVAVRVPLLLAAFSLRSDWVIPGLALATAISYVVGAIVGEIWLRARFGPMGSTRTFTTVGKMLLASAVGGAAAYFAVDKTVGITPTSVGNGILIVLIGGAVGLIVIAIMTSVLRVQELAPVRNRVLRLLGRTPAVAAGASAAAGAAPATGPPVGGPPVGGARASGFGTSAGFVPAPRFNPALGGVAGAGPGPGAGVAGGLAAGFAAGLAGRGPVVTGNTPAGMGRSPGGSGMEAPTVAQRRPTAHQSSPLDREQVTERVTHAGAGGPRDTTDEPTAVSPESPTGNIGAGNTGTTATTATVTTNGDGPTVSSNDPVSDNDPASTNDPVSTNGDGPTATNAAPGVANGSASADVSRQNADNTVNLGGTPVSHGPPVVLAPGATVGGRYRLVSLVATDDAGNRFWRAKDTVLPRDMAVTLLPDTNATSATVARTLRVGRLHHIGLPQTLDVGTEQGQSYVVGQWVDGATLTDLLAGGPLEPDVATSITAKVSEAVAEAHRNGIALGAINPSLVRVNFDGQVRLSHVIAHGSATPDQDIRAVGGLLYLMLTGTWPLPSTSGDGPTGVLNIAKSTNADGTMKLGAIGSSKLIAAPTRRGREVPAAEVRPGVPAALSALAERALHPDDPAGIHAVGAIAALLRQPEVGPAAPVTPVDEPARPALNPAERRLVKERRVKLGVASVMIAAFSALIIIVVASLSKQVLTSIAGPSVTGVQKLSAGPAPTTSAKPAPPKTTAKTSASKPPGTSTGGTTVSSSSAPAAPVPTVQKIIGATVFDPEGDGVKDNPEQAPQAFDNNPATSWATFVYKQNFPSALKHGVGLTLQFGTAITPTSVTVASDTPGTIFEIRTSSAPDLQYNQTTALAQGTVTTGSAGAPGSITIPIPTAPKSSYLLVFVYTMAPASTGFKSDINEVAVSGY